MALRAARTSQAATGAEPLSTTVADREALHEVRNRITAELEALTARVDRATRILDFLDRAPLFTDDPDE